MEPDVAFKFNTTINGSKDSDLDIEVTFTISKGAEIELESITTFDSYWNKDVEVDLTEHQEEIVIDRAYDHYYDNYTP